MRPLIKYHEKRLLRSGIIEPYSSLEILTRRTLGIPFEVWNDPKNWPQRMAVSLLKKLHKRCRQRATHYPLQYVLGEWDFAEISVKVKSPVLIPRPETPQLIDICQSLSQNKKDCHFLEVGTGSGAISCLLLRREPNFTGEGIDILQVCVNLSSSNLAKTDSPNWQTRYTLTRADIADYTPQKLLDFVVSNPPYIGQEEFDKLCNQVKKFESATALLAADDGLAVAWQILISCRDRLKKSAFVAMELSPSLIKRLRLMEAELREIGFLLEALIRDCYSEERFVVFRLIEVKVKS